MQILQKCKHIILASVLARTSFKLNLHSKMRNRQLVLLQLC